MVLVFLGLLLDDDMKVQVQRTRVGVACLFAVAVLVLFFGQGAELGRAGAPQLSSMRLSNGKTDVEADGTIIMDWPQPSVFQQWRDHQPPANQHSVHDDCSKFRGSHVQDLCAQQLRHIRNVCSQRQNDKQQVARRDVGRSSIRGEDAGRVRGDMDDAVGRRSSGGVQDGVVDVFSYHQGKTMIMFCSVHKVASTFWIRLFRFLHNDPASARVSSLDAISKYRVHLTPFNQSRPLALGYITRRLRPGDKEFRFMFTREPYGRLWSVYIDKFVLPDFFFWTRHVSAIKDERLKKTRPKQMRRSFNICSDVSFEEFVEYAVQDRSFASSHSDDHILPISRTCNPCSFDPNFIGRLENMAEASQAVLDRLNLTFITTQRTHQVHILNQMRTVTEFVYETVIGGRNLRHCVSDEELRERLLRAFVLSGYLPPDVMGEKPVPEAASLSGLVNLVRELFLTSSRTGDKVERQRRLFMVKAYKALPRRLLLKVRDYYKDDFRFFGYDPEPPDLFSDQ